MNRTIESGEPQQLEMIKIEVARLVLLRPRLADAPPYSNLWSRRGKPTIRKPRLFIGELRNWPRRALIVHQTRAFVRGRTPLETYGVGSNRGPAAISNCYSRRRPEQPLQCWWQTVFSLEVRRKRLLASLHEPLRGTFRTFGHAPMSELSLSSGV